MTVMSCHVISSRLVWSGVISCPSLSCHAFVTSFYSMSRHVNVRHSWKSRYSGRCAAYLVTVAPRAFFVAGSVSGATTGRTVVGSQLLIRSARQNSLMFGRLSLESLYIAQQRRRRVPSRLRGIPPQLQCSGDRRLLLRVSRRSLRLEIVRFLW